MPTSQYMVLPKVSSERRIYIPFGYVRPSTLSSDLLFISSKANLYHFGFLSSEMHMAWIRAVCGRLESRYRYSNTLVYNNFPWPKKVSIALKTRIENAAQAILDERVKHPTASLADLYDPLTMPVGLLKAHQANDRAVDAAYTRRKFKSEAERIAFLFERYDALVQL